MLGTSEIKCCGWYILRGGTVRVCVGKRPEFDRAELAEGTGVCRGRLMVERMVLCLIILGEFLRHRAGVEDVVSVSPIGRISFLTLIAEARHERVARYFSLSIMQSRTLYTLRMAALHPRSALKTYMG